MNLIISIMHICTNIVNTPATTAGRLGQILHEQHYYMNHRLLIDNYSPPQFNVISLTEVHSDHHTL